MLLELFMILSKLEVFYSVIQDSSSLIITQPVSLNHTFINITWLCKWFYCSLSCRRQIISNFSVISLLLKFILCPITSHLIENKFTSDGKKQTILNRSKQVILYHHLNLFLSHVTLVNTCSINIRTRLLQHSIYLDFLPI